MFNSKNKEIMYTPVNPNLTIQKWGVSGYTVHGHVFMMKTGTCFGPGRKLQRPVYLIFSVWEQIPYLTSSGLTLTKQQIMTT